MNKPLAITSLNFKEPSNKKIVPQKRFYSTKKSRAKKPRLEKPTREEQINACYTLLKQPIVSFDSKNDHN